MKTTKNPHITRTGRRNIHKTGTIRLPNKIPEMITTMPITKSGFVEGPARPCTGIRSVIIMKLLYRKNANGKI